MIIHGSLHKGIQYPMIKFAIIAESDMFGEDKKKRRKRRQPASEGERIRSFKELSVGDYVVHEGHGVGIYRGIENVEVDGVAKDYIKIEYGGGGSLYILATNLDMIQKYADKDTKQVKVNKMSGPEWTRTKTKVKGAVRELAMDLVKLYAARQESEGYVCGPDTVWQREFEEMFPYEETQDQLDAIEATKRDMESTKIMDRLVCGDVGFGKTEVAIRAAFKMVQEGRQCAVLVPTTILAQQHYTSFKDRFDPFGVTVEVLSRFRTSEQQKAALAGFAKGDVQVLVGTHRLLSRDVNPHDLGLVIIDEEQRFGVQHKEQLKNLRESIDVLTLSATPIPRTMQMSLSGVRDMSLILTPPDERRPVEVHVGEWDPDVVSAAIRYELARGGQVYYVSNRVHAAAGEARVGVAHGQMTKEELEQVMEEFAAGELDVLVATTIIESGIDNPHTNTLIIEDAQRLGLAQMYQLKGRVGRSSTQAYAYFMFPENVPLTEEAAARLTAINEHQDLGSGMRIAMRDLEIRGAGSMLGAEQSGNMSAVGFDLFAQMLNQAVNETREGTGASGELPPALSDITVNIPGHAYLPEEYIPDADARVLWYRKLASAATVEEVAALREDMLAKAPEMPEAAANLFERAWLKAFANEHGVKLISVAAGKLIVEPIDIPAAAMKPLRRAAGRYQADRRKLTLPLRYFSEEERENLLPAIVHFLEKLFGEDDAEEEAPFAEIEADNAASGPAAVALQNAATGSAGAASGSPATGATAAGSENAPTDSRKRGPRSALGHASAKGSASAAPASARPTARSERRANNLAKGDAARERLAAKRAARAAKREEGR